MDNDVLSRVADRYYALRGLLLVPGGLLIVAGGVGNLQPDDAGTNLIAVGLVLAVVAAGYAAAVYYYKSTFGLVNRRSSSKVRDTIFTTILAVGTIGASTADFQLDLPVSLFGATWAALWLIYYRSIVGLKPYHAVFLGGLGVVSLAPIWGDVADKASVAMVVIGVATVALGLFDHRELLHTVRQARTSGMVDLNASA